MSEFDDLTFITNIKNYIKENCDDLKEVEIFQFPEKPMFPIAIVSTNQAIERPQDLDSARTNKFYSLSINIDVLTKSNNTIKNRYISCITIKNSIINLLKSSDYYHNLILSLDRNIPNLDSQVCRWRLTFEGLIDVKNNRNL